MGMEMILFGMLWGQHFFGMLWGWQTCWQARIGLKWTFWRTDIWNLCGCIGGRLCKSTKIDTSIFHVLIDVRENRTGMEYHRVLEGNYTSRWTVLSCMFVDRSVLDWDAPKQNSLISGGPLSLACGQFTYRRNSRDASGETWCGMIFSLSFLLHLWDNLSIIDHSAHLSTVVIGSQDWPQTCGGHFVLKPGMME